MLAEYSRRPHEASKRCRLHAITLCKTYAHPKVDSQPTTSMFSLRRRSDQSLARLSLTERDVVCISAVPPFALASARGACERVRRLAPSAKVIVGLWGYSGDIDRLMARFGSARPDLILTTLASAVEQISLWETGGGAAVAKLALQPAMNQK